MKRSAPVASALCLAVAFSLLGCQDGPNGLLRVSGQIEGTDVTAGSRVGGRVMEVAVEEGDTVPEGALLVRLEDGEARALVDAAAAQVARLAAVLAKVEAGATAEQLAQAEAAVRTAEEALRMAERGARAEEISTVQAKVDAARAQRDSAKTEFARAKRLFDQGAIPRQKYDQAKTLLDTASAQLAGAEDQLALVKEGPREEEIAMTRAQYERAEAALAELQVGAREEDLAAARAAVQAAKADQARAQTALKEMQITAPISGLVESVDVRPGDLVKPGPVVRMVDPEDLELKIYVGATYLGYLQVGQQVTFTTDTHGEDRFEGTIIHIASQGEFTPRNLQTQEERVQQVFAVKIRLTSAEGKLRAGMTATVLLEKVPE